MVAESGPSRVEITIEGVRQIAKTTMEQLKSEARSGSSDFRNTHLSEGAFGEVPKARAYAKQQEAAAGVFRDTIDGVLNDLAKFQDNLLASAKAHEGNDEAVAAALTGLSARYGPGHQYSAEKKYDAGRHDEALKLPEGQDGAEGTAPIPGEDGSPADPGTPAAPDVASQGQGTQGIEGRAGE